MYTLQLLNTIAKAACKKIEQIYEDAGEIISHTTGTVIWNGNNIHIEYNDGNHADYTLENGQISKIEYAENDYYWSKYMTKI